MFFSTTYFCLFFFGGLALIALGFIVVRKYKNRALIQLLAAGSLYPLGEGLQQVRDLPSFIRWHISDFGFIPMLGVALMLEVLHFGWYRWAKPLLTIIFICTVSQEIGDYYLLAIGKPMGSHRGDWVDVLMYVLSFVLSLRLYTLILAEEMRQFHEWKLAQAQQQSNLPKKKKRGRKGHR